MRNNLFKITQVAALAFGLALTFSCSGGDDSEVLNFKTKQIGSQVWMVENLNYNVEGSKCYNNQESNCDKYGRLYDWATAMALPSSCNSTSCASQINAKHKGICPSGWHIPSDDEWATLLKFVDGIKGGEGEDCGRGNCYDSYAAGKYLKAKSGWNEDGNGTDEFGFTAMPGGGSYFGAFLSIGELGAWWSASEDDATFAIRRNMDYDLDGVYWFGYNKNFLFSVRCLQD